MNSAGTSVVGKQGYGKPLPRGRHGLPRTKVIAHQQQRMLWAATIELGQRGFIELTVGHIIARARVSRVTFYESFEDKLDCVLAAHQAAIAELEPRVRLAYRNEEGWAAGISGVLEELLDFATESPEKLNLILFVQNAAGEPKIGQFGLGVRERLLHALRAARGKDERVKDKLSEYAAIGAALAVLEVMVKDGGAERRAEFKEHLIRLVLAPYLGEAKARGISVSGTPAPAQHR